MRNTCIECLNDGLIRNTAIYSNTLCPGHWDAWYSAALNDATAEEWQRAQERV